MYLLLLEVSLVSWLKHRLWCFHVTVLCAYVGSRTQQQWKYLTSKRMGMLKIGGDVWFQTITPLSVTVREICQTLNKNSLNMYNGPEKKPKPDCMLLHSITKYQTKCSLFKSFWNWCCAHSEVHRHDFVWCGISRLHKATGLNFEFSNHLLSDDTRVWMRES